jgi:hypothetical protein
MLNLAVRSASGLKTQFPPGKIPEPTSAPSGADLIAEILPSFDGTSLGQAVDQFFRELGEVEVANFAAPRPSNLLMISLSLVSAFTALEFARRRWSRRIRRVADLRVRDAQGWGGHLGFPERPGSWSERVL